MSDLISRNVLLDTFNNTGKITFDLPVEEILGGDVDIDDFTMLMQDAIQAYKKMVIDTIRNQTTAYNPDKVVEELKKIEEHCLEMNDWQGQSAVVDSIEIVKHGGVTEDVCEWKKEPSRLVGYFRNETSCGDSIDLQGNSELLKAFKFCPYCGKKIKVVV